MAANLIIVESPAKAKTIEKYLGKDFSVKATMGHLRDLPKSKMGVDIPAGFVIDYKPIAGKEKTISDLHARAKKAKRVYLATDPDREGEAISWHLKQLLELPDEKTARVTFNEITKKVVRESIENPRGIDADLVDAQQTRRVIDRILGYELSPLLWRKIKPGLSAGRVQSVATRLVVDRELEIRAFTPDEYWSLDVTLARADGGAFMAHFYGDTEGKQELKNKEDTDVVMAAVEKAPFSVRDVRVGVRKRNPAPPFITSTLQQEASRKLGLTARRAMAVAQQLYEGINIKDLGPVGLITYMRTDSLRLSDEATGQARAFIKAQYGVDYCPSATRVYKSKSNAQDAHEAIRPTDVNLTPDYLKASLTEDQWRLYKLIWSRFVACQMQNALYDTLSIDVLSAGYIFRANHTSLRFAGFTAVYEEGRDDDNDDVDDPLPNLTRGEALTLQGTTPGQHFTQPPPRYTEASLIKAMEESGIGRPSTYAPTISTIMEREYVCKQGRALSPTPLGEVVTTMMKERFNDIINVAFTARMENDLDMIEEGRKNWKAMLAEFYGVFHEALTLAIEDKTRYKVPDEPTDLICELCGRQMVIKMGRYGRFFACPGYPDCKNTKPMSEPTPGECPACGATILKKKSRNNRDYYGCEKHPACGFMTWDAPVGDRCPECGRTLFKKSGRGAAKPFCANAECPAFLPEDKRGYRKRKGDQDQEQDGAGNEQSPAAGGQEAGANAAATKAPAKKPAAKTTAKKAAAKKAPAKKPAAKTTAKKAATKKAPAKKATVKTAATKTATKIATETASKAATKTTSKTTAKKPTASSENG